MQTNHVPLPFGARSGKNRNNSIWHRSLCEHLFQVTTLCTKCSFLWAHEQTYCKVQRDCEVIWPPPMCMCRYAYSSQIQKPLMNEHVQVQLRNEKKKKKNLLQSQNWSQIKWQNTWKFVPQNHIRSIQIACSVSNYRVWNPPAVSPLNKSFSCQVKWVPPLKAVTKTYLKYQPPLSHPHSP